MNIQTEAPSRLSLFGGGTDIPSYSDKYGGVVINLAINLKQRFTLGFDAPGKAPKMLVPGGKPDFYKAFFDRFKIPYDNTLILESYDGLIETGIGSSASAAVSLVGAFNEYGDLDMSREQIAETAWHIENHELKLYGGRQDQYASVFGGLNAFEFSKDKVEVLQLVPSVASNLLPSLALFYTGKKRVSPIIQEEFKELSTGQIEALGRIKAIAKEAVKPLIDGDIQKIGALLDKSWEMKKKSNKKTSNPDIDKFYQLGKKNGAYGGKVCGAGGGGFMFFVVDPDKRNDFISKMQVGGLQWWDFDICGDGLQVRRMPE